MNVSKTEQGACGKREINDEGLLVMWLQRCAPLRVVASVASFNGLRDFLR